MIERYSGYLVAISFREDQTSENGSVAGRWTGWNRANYFLLFELFLQASGRMSDNAEKGSNRKRPGLGRLNDVCDHECLASAVQ